ncbi:hypothetical protein ACFVVM_29750 [Nocardia sp. NPDC058176]|uniref:hypothetical protein n=1 Tax=Nocardia sp. NPDC058176 TaxID=3346368 RepID=UPI0036DCF526
MVETTIPPRRTVDRWGSSTTAAGPVFPGRGVSRIYLSHGSRIRWTAPATGLLSFTRWLLFADDIAVVGTR